MKSLRRFFARLPVWRRGEHRTNDCAKKSRNISLCKPPKIFGPVYHRLRRGAKPC